MGRSLVLHLHTWGRIVLPGINCSKSCWIHRDFLSKIGGFDEKNLGFILACSTKLERRYENTYDVPNRPHGFSCCTPHARNKPKTSKMCRKVDPIQTKTLRSPYKKCPPSSALQISNLPLQSNLKAGENPLESEYSGSPATKIVFTPLNHHFSWWNSHDCW